MREPDDDPMLNALAIDLCIRSRLIDFRGLCDTAEVLAPDAPLPPLGSNVMTIYRRLMLEHRMRRRLQARLLALTDI